jgi:ATP-binding cassette subfamily F protein uup
MAETPLLTLTDITLGWGGDPLFAGLSLAVHPGDRICLVGRNGSGKSTLLKVMAGEVEPDGGERFVQPGARITRLSQDPDLTGYATLGAFVSAKLEPEDMWKAEMAMDGLAVKADADPASASGGERRRAALARVVAEEPELLLLDEPTNHLDIEAIAWVEDWLSQTRAAFVLISHDRAFLRRLTRASLWLDRGEARRVERGFDGFEDWRDKIWEEEDAQRHKLDRLIKAEARWAVEGISARRKRNMGRVRRLGELRDERSGQIRRQGAAAMALEGGPKSGRLVIEAKEISKSFGDRAIIRDFSLRVMRGDRIAFVGPNGAGKTTLLNLLMGSLAPDGGDVRHGANLMPAVFDQARMQLDDEASLWDSLTGDPHLGVSGNSDQVLVRGRPKHVIAYLKDFLFDERQARGPVKALSGGERARLLLAKIMARESNLLILDEPTNDLDVETLDLLQELVGDFDGTVLLVSHDRDFLDRTASTTIAMNGDGTATVYAGGWTDYQTQKALSASDPDDGTNRPALKPAGGKKRGAGAAAKSAPKPGAAKKLSAMQGRRLESLPAEMERFGAEIAKLEAFLSDPALFKREPGKFRKATEGLSHRRGALAKAEEEWLELESLREALA